MLDTIFQIIVGVIILPVILVLSTPIILIRGIFTKGSYVENIKENYGRIIKWWKRYIF